MMFTTVGHKGTRDLVNVFSAYFRGRGRYEGMDWIGFLLVFRKALVEDPTQRQPG